MYCSSKSSFHYLTSIIYHHNHHQPGQLHHESPCVQRGFLRHLCAYAKSPFLYVFCYVFIYKALLSYFVVFGDDFYYYFIKHLLSLFSCLSNGLVFFSMELFIEFLKTFTLEMCVCGGGGVRWLGVRTHWGES